MRLSSCSQTRIAFREVASSCCAGKTGTTVRMGPEIKAFWEMLHIMGPTKADLILRPSEIFKCMWVPLMLKTCTLSMDEICRTTSSKMLAIQNL